MRKLPKSKFRKAKSTIKINGISCQLPHNRCYYTNTNVWQFIGVEGNNAIFKVRDRNGKYSGRIVKRPLKNERKQ